MDKKYNKSEIKIFLESVSIMSIAVNLQDKPISSVVLFTVDNDLSFYFLTKRETYKAKALNTNNQISISTWTQNKMLVQAYGSVTEIGDSKEQESFYKRFSIISKNVGNIYWPLTVVKGSEYVIYKVLTEWLRVMDLSNSKDTPYYTLEL